MNTTAIRMNRVTFSYNNGPVLRDVDLCIDRGEMVGLIGPNGAGKTTLIRLVSGVLAARQGGVRLGGVDTKTMKRHHAAREVAVVPAQFDLPLTYRVDDVVMLGRTPFMSPWRDISVRDREVVRRTMDTVGVSHLRRRCFGELSGGERQKVVLAMALAQEAGLLLLDEPTAHLDISHQVEILELLAGMNADRRLTVVAAMHDLNLASAYFRRLVLLKGGSIVADGTPAQVLTSGTISSTYSVPVHIQPHPSSGVPQVIVVPPGNGHRPAG